MKILLIEDELKLAGFIKKSLEQAGYIVDFEHDGVTGLQTAMVNSYDLILLDLMLPSQNGFEVLKNMRSFDNNVPVIIMSALSSTEQIIKGLDLGASDYLRKPVEMQELLARLRVLQRQQKTGTNPKIKICDLEIDIHARQLKRNDKSINLSNREFMLLEYLALNPNKIITKNQLLEKVWNMNFDPGSNVIEVHLYHLRKKLNEGFSHQHIQTVIGRGYIFKVES